MPEPSYTKRRWLVVAFAVFLYVPSLAFTRVDWDDRWLWADDSPLRHFDVAEAREVFFQMDRHARHPLGSEYLPVRDTLTAVDMAIWGDNEHGPHVTQLLLFALTVLALGSLLERFGVPPAVAWLGTLIFAAHPIHVESVAWLSERKGILALLFVLCCGHAWVRFRAGRSRWWLAVAALAAIAATWSKAPAMFGPPVLAAWDLLLLPAARRRWVAIAAVGLATALAAAPVVRIAQEAHVIGVAEEGGDREGRVATALGAQGHYVESITCARPFAMSYPMNADGPAPLDIALGVIATLASAGAALWCWRRKHKLGLALLAWAWIWYVPIGHLVVPLHIIVADRFAYPWSAAACIAAGWGVTRLPARWRLAAGGALVVALSVMTIRAEGTWNTSVDVFGNGCASNPDDITACAGHVGALDEEGRVDEALAAAAEYIGRHPDNPYLLDKRAHIYERHGDRADALVDAAHAAQSGVGTATSQYAEMLLRAGRPLEALPWASRAVARHPEEVIYAKVLAAAVLMTAGIQP